MAAPAERSQFFELPLRPAVCIGAVMAVKVLVVGNDGEPAGDVAAAAIGLASIASLLGTCHRSPFSDCAYSLFVIVHLAWTRAATPVPPDRVPTCLKGSEAAAIEPSYRAMWLASCRC
jgi:hypothetical protein